jgi:Ca-activated chloride channel family protein
MSTNSNRRGNEFVSTGRPTVLVTPLQQGFPQEGGTLDVLIRVQAPSAPATIQRLRPLHLSLVLDRSGSMNGRKLAEAIRCAEYIVQNLSPDDKAAVIVYDDQVDTLVPLTPVADKLRFLSALQGVRSGGSTALHNGWLQGANSLASSVAESSLSRVILLSDGQANHGLTRPDKIAQQCNAMAGAGISTTTVGLGEGFNEDLMMQMARQGGGQSYYGQSAEDIKDKFIEEFSLIETLYARNLTAQMFPAPGVIIELVSVMGASSNDPVPLSDLSYDAEVFLAVRLNIVQKPAGTHALLSVIVKGEQMDRTPFETSTVILEAPALPKSVVSALPKEELVETRHQEAKSAQLLDEIRQSLFKGDRKTANRLLAEVKVLARDNEWLQNSIVAMERLIEQNEDLALKELAYKRDKLRNRQAAQNEDRSRVDSPDIPAHLRRKTEEGK